MKDINFKNIICFFDDYNGANIYAAINLKPDRMLFISDDSEILKEDYENIKNHLIRKLPGLKVESAVIDKISYDALADIIKSFNIENTAINLSRGNRLLNLMAFKICQEEGYKPIYSDMDDEVIIDLNSKELKPVKRAVQEMKITDLIAGSGGEILQDSSRFYEDERIIEFVEYIIEHYSLWKKLKGILRNNLYIQYSELYPLTVTMNAGMIVDMPQFMPFLKKGSDIGLYKLLKGKHDYIILQFYNMNYKSFVFKAGTWLEVLVYNIVKEIKEVDDVKAGAVFLWDTDQVRLKNEADVLATAGSQLLYISCKDTPNYDENALNELEVYAEKIGGEDAVKILISTVMPSKSTTFLRAEEMGIKILIFQGEKNKLKSQLINIISKCK